MRKRSDHRRALVVSPRDAPTSGLPAQLTSFVGRERELDEVVQAAEGSRLLTLVGPGGVGKTRLALRAAEKLAGTVPDGVWFVDLSPVADMSLVGAAMASAVELADEGTRDPVDGLHAALRDRCALLVVDNCEHVIDAVALVIDTLLRGCAGIRVLATSRESLGVEGERTWAVPTLEVAPDGLTPDELERFDSVQLFVERAKAVEKRFRLTSSNAAAVSNLCRCLDGLPLALELAAARVGAMPVAELSDRLELRLLRAPRRAGAERHRTLEAAIDWSYHLLTPAEQELFRRLSVFAGSFSLHACEEVCETSMRDVIEHLTRLVEKSMVVAAQDEAGRARYRLLETVREYARRALDSAEDTDEPARRHLAHYGSLAQTADADRNGDAARFDQTEQEHDNLRAALAWALEHEPDAAVALAASLAGFWHVRGHWHEGRRWLQAAVACGGGTSASRARVVDAAARAAWRNGDLDEAISLFEDGIAISRTSGDRRQLVDTLAELAFVAAGFDRGELAVASSNEALALSERADPWLRARALYGAGVAALCLGSPTARALLDGALESARRSDDTLHLSGCLQMAAAAAVQEGDAVTGRALLDECVTVKRSLGYPTGIAGTLPWYGKLAADLGNPELGVRLAGAHAAQLERVGWVRGTMWVRLFEAWLAPAKRALGSTRTRAATAQGRRLSIEEAIAQAQGTSTERSALTVRELEVASLVAEGLTNRQIAERLVLSERTVDAHLEHIRTKLGVRSRVEIASRLRG